MNGHVKFDLVRPQFGHKDIIAAAWIATALALLFPVTSFLNGAFPIFTLILLVVPLADLLRNRDVKRIGFRVLLWSDFIKYTFINLAGSLALMAVSNLGCTLMKPW